jgi:hypothetical protein
MLRHHLSLHIPIAIAILRCRASGGGQHIERLSFRVDGPK